MKIRVNGAERETNAATVAALLAELGLPPQAALIELNGEAVPRGTWDSAPLKDGDVIEVLRVAAGG